MYNSSIAKKICYWEKNKCRLLYENDLAGDKWKKYSPQLGDNA